MRTVRDILPAPLGLVIALAVAASSTGCAGHPSQSDDSVALAEDGTDANDVESQSSALTASFTLASGDFSDPAVSVSASSSIGGFFTPSTCITAAQDAPNATVTYTLVNCDGPWGLASVSGAIKVVYSAVDPSGGNPGLKLDVSGDSLEFNSRRPSHASATLHATATITADGGAREMNWSATLNGTTARGNSFARTATWDVRWRVGESCIQLDGTADGDVNGRSLETVVSDYQRCLGACPAAGGSITIKNESDGEQVSVDYNGGNNATFTGVTGKQTRIDLACGL